VGLERTDPISALIEQEARLLQTLRRRRRKGQPGLSDRDRISAEAELRKCVAARSKLEQERDSDSHVIELTDRVADLERTLASGRSGGQVRASAAPVLARSGDDRH